MFRISIRYVYDKNSRKRSYYVCYTLVFVIVAFLCFAWFIFWGKSLIWKDDGWYQHFKALVYYAQYLRKIIRNLLFGHQLIIPDWDFYIAEGSDIVNAMHYYCIGDPIALFSVFVPTRYMHYFYSFSVVLRLYLAGIAFSMLCFGTGKKNRYGILSGAIAYSFCYWALFNANRHPFFLNPMIFFPLIILGIEKIVRKEKSYLFIITVAISAASNFYFFYMIVLLAILYTVIRLICMSRSLHQKFLIFIHIGLMALIGVCIAGIIFLPVLMIFTHDSRFSGSQHFQWFYPMSYYSKLPGIFITDTEDYWLCMGYTSSVILAAFLMFLEKNKDTFLKILFTTGIIIMLFPVFGRILNGMSYMSNRWSWSFALLCAYILAAKWEDLLSLSSREWRRLALFCTVYYLICFLFSYSRTDAAFSGIAFLCILLISLRIEMNEPKKSENQQLLLLLLTSFGVIQMAFWKYSPVTHNYISEAMEFRDIWRNWKNNEAISIKKLSEYPYTRISGRMLSRNANIENQISSTQYFWSISNPYVGQFRSELQMREEVDFNYLGYDDRTTPITLSAVQYYSVNNNNMKGLPYGFSFFTKTNDELNTYSIYKNDYTLPFAYCYDAYFKKDVWDAYNPVQKQQAQLEAAYVNENLEGLNILQSGYRDYIIPYEDKIDGNKITASENGYITTANNISIVLNLSQEIKNAETYVGIEGLEFQPVSEYDLYFGDESVDPLNLYNWANWDKLTSDKKFSLRKDKFYWNSIQNAALTIKSDAGIQKIINYRQPESSFSSGRHNFLVNLGYLEEPVTHITITFSSRGIYSFDSLTVYSIPMDDYPQKIADLQEDTLQNITIGIDSVSGNISLDGTKLLCLTTPYSKGWEAIIDGEQTKVYLLNERYLGIVIPKGEHSISFLYHMPYKRAGFGLSLFGIGVFFVMRLTDLIKIQRGKKLTIRNKG